MSVEVMLLTSLLAAGKEDQHEFMRRNIPTAFFKEQNSEYVFLREFYDRHRLLPTKETFGKHFGDFQFTHTDEPLGYHAEELFRRENYNTILQTMEKVNKRLMKKGLSAVDDACRLLSDCNGEIISPHYSSDVNFNDLADHQLALYERESGEASRKIKPPYQMLIKNRIVTGFAPQNFFVLMGRFGLGKSWYLLNFAISAAMQGFPTLWITPEMSVDETTLRLAAMLFNLNYSDMVANKLPRKEIKRWKEAVAEFKFPAPFIMCDAADYWGAKGMRGSPVQFIRSKIEQYGTAANFVDSAHLFYGLTKGVSMVEDAYRISRAMKQEVAKATKSVLSISIQSGRQAEGKRKGGGAAAAQWADAFGQDADVYAEIGGIRGDLFRTLVFHKTRAGAEGELVVRFQIEPVTDFSEIEVRKAISYADVPVDEPEEDKK